MIRSLLPALLCALALAGCLSFNAFDEGLAGFKGRPVSEAFDALGYPDGQQQFGEETVYTWGSSYTGVAFSPSTTTTSGAIGSTPFRATTTGTAAVPVSYECTIKMIVGPDQVVRKYQWEGNRGGCESYMRRLQRAAQK